jgi:hypothetical protein
MPARDDDIPASSIVRELIVNQYQAILAGGAALASVATLNPVPFLLWLGAEMVLLPILDSGPLRRLVARRRREIARVQENAARERLVGALSFDHRKRFSAMEDRCRLIEANYQGLTGTSQAYLGEQRRKLDVILQGAVHRLIALQRYETMPPNRDREAVEEEIASLEKELKAPDLNDRAQTALSKSIELKRRLLASLSEVDSTVKALRTEIDSIESLIEVLHTNSISLRDPQAIADELDEIVRHSEDSERVVREMEALLGGSETWDDRSLADAAPSALTRSSGGRNAAPSILRN